MKNRWKILVMLFLSWLLTGVGHFTLPFDAEVVITSGWLYPPDFGGSHYAIDYSLEGGTKLYAAASGEVITVEDCWPNTYYGHKPEDEITNPCTKVKRKAKQYGNILEIRHDNGYVTIYAHLLSNKIN